jgi:hypothetical protein
MNPITHTQHARRPVHARIGAGTWDDFEPVMRRRRNQPIAASIARSKAHPHHSHLSWSETPDLYLREEMG